MQVTTETPESTANPRDLRELVAPDRVHHRLYTDPAIFDLEMARIFGRVWLYTAHESQLRESGDFIRTRLGRHDVLAVRHRDGEIHVLHNACAHRGAKLCAVEGGNAPGFTCPYHGWSFQTDGALASLPHRKSYPEGFDRKDPKYALKRAPRVESYRGFVFASFAADGPSLTDFLGPMTGAIDNLVDRAPAGEIEVAGGSFQQEYRGNWKLHHENANDTVHPGFVHESSVATARDQKKAGRAGGVDDQQTRDMMMANGFSLREWEAVDLHGVEQGHSWMGGFYSSGLLSPNQDDPVSQAYRAAMVAAYGEDRTDEILGLDRFNNLVWPNLSINAQFHQLRIVTPLAPDRTLVRGLCFRLKGAPEGIHHRAVRFLTTLSSPASMIFSDDIEIFERVQRGLGAGGNEWLDVARGFGRDAEDTAGSATAGSWHSTTPSELPIRAQSQAWLRWMTADA